MKNLNPKSGLKQIVNGYLCLPRKIFFQFIKEKKLTPNELGYYLIAIMSADWDGDKYRHGFIRHELQKLSAIWGKPYGTLHGNFKKLVEKELLEVDQSTFKVKNFHNFTSNGALEFVGDNRVKDEDLKQYFPNIVNDFEIPKKQQSRDSCSFRSSSKGESSISLNRLEFSRGDKLVISNGLDKGGLGRLERDVVDVFFKGDWDYYSDHLIDNPVRVN